MKLAVTPFHIQDIDVLLDAGADIIIAGNNKYANRLVASFSDLELTDIATKTHARGKELYVPVNLIVHHQDLSAMDSYLDLLSTLAVDGILFGDLAVYQLGKQKGLANKLIYHPETLNTNTYDPIFWAKQGIKGITLAKEITLHDILTICDQSPIEISMIGHGHLNMFHSRRPLIENYFKYRKEDYESYIDNRNLRLIEEVRNESYPVFQDDHGTHIFREKAMESFAEVSDLNNHIDVFIIDAILEDPAYLFTMLTQYVTLRENGTDALVTSLKETYLSDHDTGFLHKNTVSVKQ